jgi:hypothetical protein
MATSAPITLAGYKKKKKPVIRKVWIPGDDEIAEAFQTAEQKYKTLLGLHRTRPDDATIAADLHVAQGRRDDLEVELRKTALLFKFRSIGRVKFDALVKDHPPTTDQKEEVAAAGKDPKDLAWDPDGFSISLTAACSLEPKMTREEVRELFDDEDWTQTEAATLFECALKCNMEMRQINLDAVGNDSRGTNGSR